MRILKTLTAAAAITAISTSAFAGGLSPEIMEAPVMEEAMVAAPSINPGYIVVGVLALLLVGAALGSDDNGGTIEREPIKDLEGLQPCETCIDPEGFR